MSADNELHVPADERAERAVLGAILVDPDCYPRAAAAVDGADFHNDAHGRIFDACRALAETGIAPDLVTIPDQLERDGTLALAGGVAYVASLAQGLPDPANVEHYAAIVRACARKRHLLFLGQRLAAEAAGSNGGGLAAVQAELAAALEDSGSGRAASGPALLARLGTHRLTEIATTAPPPLLVSRCDPLGHTILFGPGGVGKGVLACQWIVELARLGHVVVIVDYESHPEEWSRRILSLGGPEAHATVYHVAPLTPAWRGAHGAIWTQAADLHALVEELHATFVVVDSTIPACGGVDPMKPEAASLYAGALQFIGRPVLSLAHVTKADDQRYPFGSVFWHNLSRVTWSLSPGGSNGEHSVILTHRKRNNYGSLGKLLIHVRWEDGLPVEVTERRYSAALADRIVVELTAGPQTVSELVTVLNDNLDEGAEKFRPDSIRAALRRGAKATPKRFTFTGKGAAARWSNA
ncbi:MAG TPA: DnaB-like helicase N-terminal domain-containing protein [Thermoanaerobaculaceae bacterium]|nr:DnaB-like helicase N-terminal domain-containing protein [Thermoanaerobaculaceae bacterium]